MSGSLLDIGIDASNIRAGGGLTHLSQLLTAAEPAAAAVGRVVVWGGGHTLSRLPDRPWLAKRHVPTLDRSLPWRAAWQQAILPRLVGREGCGLLFAPGGTLPRFVAARTVTMSQNMLPFEPEEAARFGRGSHAWWKMQLLRRAQARSFRQADGVIFLTDYARTRVLAEIGGSRAATRIIPHGLEPRFFADPRVPVPVSALGLDRPFRLLYVSQVDMYKHQWQVVRAVRKLRDGGLPLTLDLVGGSYPPALALLQDAMREADPDGAFVQYRGLIPFDELHRAYRDADAFVFASSCENMPNILLEAMASGLPVACSSRGPMPEMLGDAAVWFDPLHIGSIAAAIGRLVADSALRGRLARDGRVKARAFSWRRCVRETLDFFREIGTGAAA